MKRSYLVFVILAVMCLAGSTAFAAGKLSTTQENFYVTQSGSSFYGNVYAKVENVGDHNAEYSAGLLEIYDESGDTLASDSYLSVFGRYVAPGDYVYLKGSEGIDGIAGVTEVDDYLLTVSGKSSQSDRIVKKLPCDPSYIPDYPHSKYSVYDTMFATVTNNTDQIVYGITVVFALLDADDNILFVDSHGLYDDVGLNPGSSLTVKKEIYDTYVEAYERAGLSADHVDAYAYYEEEAE